MQLHKFHLTHQKTEVRADLYIPMIDINLRKNFQTGTSTFGTPKTGPAIIFEMRRNDKQITQIVKVSSLERSLTKFKDSQFIYFYKKINSLKPKKFEDILESTVQYVLT